MLLITLISRIGWAEYLIQRYKWINQTVVFYTPLSLFLAWFVNRIREPSVLSFLTWHKMDNEKDNIRASSSWLTNGRWTPQMMMNFTLYNEFLGAVATLQERGRWNHQCSMLNFPCSVTKSKNFQNNEHVVDEDDSRLLILHLATSDAEKNNNKKI